MLAAAANNRVALMRRRSPAAAANNRVANPSWPLMPRRRIISVAAAASSSSSSTTPTASLIEDDFDSDEDPYRRAALRLEEVLAQAQEADGVPAFLPTSDDDIDPPTLPGAPPPIRGLRLLPPDERLAAASHLGTMIGAASLLVSWVCGSDPLGGASLSSQSLSALVAGGSVGALPLIALALLGRAPPVRRAFPTLAALQSDTRATLRPLVRGLTLSQVFVMALWMSLPSCLMLCPTCQAVVSAARAMLSACLLPASSPVVLLPPTTIAAVAAAGPAATAVAAAAPGLSRMADVAGEMGDAAAGLAPALLASYAAASAVAMALSPRARQLSAVRDAARSAERWFRLERAHRRGASAAVGAEEQQQQQREVGQAASSTALSHGTAFRSLALTWARERRAVARLAFVLSALQLMYVHQLWSVYGDVSAAAGALTLAWTAELLLAGDLFGFGGDGDGNNRSGGGA